MKVLSLVACIVLAGCSEPSSSVLTGPSGVSPRNDASSSEVSSPNATGNLEILFTKWITTPEGAMSGVVALGSTEGVFAGQVNALEDFGNGLGQVQATYGVTVGDVEFSAEISGHQNHAGRGVLNGRIESGDYVGARVHVEYQATDAADCVAESEVAGAQGGIDGFCYIGTITVMSRSAN